MSFEVDAFQEFLYVDEALQIWSDLFGRCCLSVKNGKIVVCGLLTSKKSPHLPINFGVFSFVPLEKNHQVQPTGTPLFRFSRKKWVFFHGRFSQKRSPVSRCEVCSGRCCDLKRQRETQRATCKDRVGIWKHGTFFWAFGMYHANES